MQILFKWGIAFLATIIIEWPIIHLAFSSIKKRNLLAAFITANGVSHLSLWFLFIQFAPYGLWLTLSEALVCVIEIIVYRNFLDSIRIRPIEMFYIVLANALSCIAGLIYHSLFP